MKENNQVYAKKHIIINDMNADLRSSHTRVATSINAHFLVLYVISPEKFPPKPAVEEVWDILKDSMNTMFSKKLIRKSLEVSLTFI